MVMGLVGAGLGVAAPLIANKLGIGKNDTRARTFNETSAYNPNALQYGGSAGAANAAAMRFSAQAQDAQARQAAQAGLVGTDYGRANTWENAASSDRLQQGRVARMMMARAQGLVPSIASQQAALDMQRATAAQSSAAASARGAAGLALAGQNAANNTATMQSAISNSAQINAANERMAAEQNALGAYSGIRAGDAQMQAQSAQQAQYNAQLAAQQNQFNAGLQQQQHAFNDQYALGLYGQENNVRALQMQGGIAGQNLLGNSHNYSTGLNVGISGENANREYDYYRQALGAFQGGLSGATPMLGGGGGSTAAPPPPPPINGVGNGGSTNMVGIPQAGTGSDDRMKMGMSPLGLLGVYGGGGMGMNPTSGPGASSYEVLSGGGENVAASAQAMNNVATAYQQDPTSYSGAPGAHTSMMSQGLLSDDRAKQDAYNLGKAHGREEMVDDFTAPLSGDEPSFIANTSAPIRAAYANFMPPTGKLINAVSEIRGTAEDRHREQQAALDESRRAWFGRDGFDESSDPVTQQLATGLAPIRFQYKPGMGPAGEQTGVRAQAAASQPVTASMVTQRPDGLLQLDPQMGLGTALAGVGHLAKKQQDNEAKLNGLLALAARREGY